jgi:hypothetical protein
MIEPDQFDEKLAGGGSGPTICSATVFHCERGFSGFKTLTHTQAKSKKGAKRITITKPTTVNRDIRNEFQNGGRPHPLTSSVIW